ncbi:phosphotransferase [Paenibacillus whitsoniae]|uniref:Aminoglycoside phosphotransferase n=1 Tax=Paenibacillus whitsoniae TaxID=2496558 RepID=A0A3S0C8X2_9BACL|nr:phosphotransferase [Paenibacillus whitsoniae]RTE07084.1 aminoglycoside phosphotransferase [Paenibacillus whitsoniae]
MTTKHNLDMLLNELPAFWFPQRTWTLREGVGGMNNTTRFVEVDGATYVLRLYETHRDRNKIAFEHRVLLELGRQQHALDFAIPQPLKRPNGETMVTLPGGKLAALFTYTEGENPGAFALSQLPYIGKAVGQLSAALSRIELDVKPEYAPYYEIEQIHPRCTPDAIRAFCEQPPGPFAKQKGELAYIFARYMAIYEAIPFIRSLPHQLVHGDINGSNMLIDEEGQLAAILDFEFVTRDVRVMELAVCLSDLIDPSRSESELRHQCDAFCAGYRQHIQLSHAEMRVLPLLIELRRLDVFIHFLGRYLDQVDSQAVLIDIIQSTHEKTKWLQLHGARLLFAHQ